MTPCFAAATESSIPIEVVSKDGFDDWLAARSEGERRWIAANGFDGKLGATLLLSGDDGAIRTVLFGWGDARARARGRFHFARAASSLPKGTYRIAAGLSGADLDEAAFAWLLASYRFGRYKTAKPAEAELVAPEGVDAARLEAIAAGEFLTRDLINTPASDMGPEALEAAFRDLGAAFGAETRVIRGDDLLTQNFPMIHAVGRASDQAPRLLDMRWGNPDHDTITLVGKGVCFDSGGLDIKPPSSMALMKKDMGGAATVMGLARIIMALDLPVRLRVLVPAVENSISAGAFRPGDVLTSRKGLTVEVNNTDAEGRLVLADALALADEDAPDYLFCMATLTGAARVALGPDLAPFYTDDDGLSHALSRAGRRVKDPLWRMPFWDPYEPMIEPDIADLDNAPSGGMAGSITAALFLRRFVEKATAFAHFDIYGWTPSALPGRAKGAAFMGARAIFEMLSRDIAK
jgi:leucyl aminopeptidase